MSVLMQFIITLVILFAFSMWLFKGDWFAPSTLIIIGYIISAICAMMSSSLWAFELHYNTFFILLLSVISLLVGCIFVKRLFNKRTNSDVSSRLVIRQAVACRKIKVGAVSQLLVFAFNLFLTLYIINQVGFSGFSDLSNTAHIFREEMTLSDFGVQLSKITKAFAYIYLFIFFNNIILCSEKIRYNTCYLLPSVFLILQTLLRAGRLSVLSLFVAALFMWYIMRQYKVGWKYKIRFKSLCKVVSIVVVVLVLFYYTRELVGRIDKASDNPMVEYITRYIGGSIALADDYYNGGMNNISQNFWYLFPGIAKSLSKFGVGYYNSSLYSLYYGFSPSGIVLGNVFTGTATIYNGGGLFAVILLYFIMGVLFQAAYEKIKMIGGFSVKNVFFIIIYSSFVYTVIFQSIRDYFYYNLSLGLFVEFLIFYLCIFFTLKVKIKVKRYALG